MKHFLIFSAAYFGDTLMTGALCMNLKRMYPQCYIVFVVNKPFADAARYLNGVDEVWPLDKKGSDRSVWSKYTFLKKYERRYVFDAAFIMWKNFFGALAAKFWGAKKIYAEPGALWQRFFLTNGAIDFKHWVHVQDKIAYLSELYSHMPMESMKIRYHIPDEAMAYVKKLLQHEGRPLVLINPLTKNKKKDFSLSLVAALAQQIDRAGYTPGMVGCGIAATRYYDALPPETGNILRNFSNRTTIPQLAALLAASRLLISADTGTAHLALTVNVPLVFVVYRNEPYRLRRWAPKSFYRAVTVSHEQAFKADDIWRAGKKWCL